MFFYVLFRSNTLKIIWVRIIMKIENEIWRYTKWQQDWMLTLFYLSSWIQSIIILSLEWHTEKSSLKNTPILPTKKKTSIFVSPPRVKYFPAFHPCHVISTFHNPQYERFIVNTAFSLIFHISWSSSSHPTSRGCFRSQLIQNLLSEFINSGTIYYNF